MNEYSIIYILLSVVGLLIIRMIWYLMSEDKIEKSIAPLVDKETKDLVLKLEILRNKENNKNYNNTKARNTTCENCGGRQLVKKFANTSGYISSGTRGWTHGRINTDTVLECRKCGGQQEEVDYENISVGDMLSRLLHGVCFERGIKRCISDISKIQQYKIETIRNVLCTQHLKYKYYRDIRTESFREYGFKSFRD